MFHQISEKNNRKVLALSCVGRAYSVPSSFHQLADTPIAASTVCGLLIVPWRCDLVTYHRLQQSIFQYLFFYFSWKCN